MSERDTREHEHVIDIDAAPEAVWKAITEAEEIVRWFALRAEAEPGVGGHITYRWNDLVGRCAIEAWDPPRHLRTTWMEGQLPDASTGADRPRLVVDWYLSAAKGGGTVLRLVHSGFGTEAKWDDEFDGTRRGWHFELRSLRHYLNRHVGRTRCAYWLTTPVREPAQAVWKKLFTEVVRKGSPEGLGEGDRYRFELGTGDVCSGTVVVNRAPNEFAGTLDSLGDGMLRIGYENCGGTIAHVWLSAWNAPAAEVDALKDRVDGLLKRTFA